MKTFAQAAETFSTKNSAMFNCDLTHVGNYMQGLYLIPNVNLLEYLTD